MKKTRIKSIETDDPEKYPVRCPGCRKTPRNCGCCEYSVPRLSGEGESVLYAVFVDQVATEPVRGEITGTWQARANAKVWRRPVYLDGYGPILYISDEALVEQVNKEIENKTFYVLNYENQEGCRVRIFDRDLRRRLPFLRKPRAPRKRRVAASQFGHISCT